MRIIILLVLGAAGWYFYTKAYSSGAVKQVEKARDTAGNAAQIYVESVQSDVKKAEKVRDQANEQIQRQVKTIKEALPEDQ